MESNSFLLFDHQHGATIDHHPQRLRQNHRTTTVVLLLFLLLLPPSPNNHRENPFSLSLPLSPAFSVLLPATIQRGHDHLLPLLTTSHCGSLAPPSLPHSQSQNQNRATLVQTQQQLVTATASLSPSSFSVLRLRLITSGKGSYFEDYRGEEFYY
nr:uncharacterized protein LOC114927577 [Arachis hypogaea]